MINTINIKSEQLQNGFFKTGNGLIRILIMGSCRVAPYLNYLEAVNSSNLQGDIFTIFSIDPFNWNWNEKDERVDYQEALLKCETDERLLNMLSQVDIFVHEWYANAGMFNCSDTLPKSIYQFGLAPAVDVCIPSFNDHFILFNDIVNFDAEMRKKAMQDMNVTGKLSDQTQQEIYEVSQRNLAKFYEVCAKSDIPEFASYFKESFPLLRLFHSYNHISKYFTIPMFAFLSKILQLNISSELNESFWQYDMFANSYTKITCYDLAWHKLEWDEEIVPLFQ